MLINWLVTPYGLKRVILWTSRQTAPSENVPDGQGDIACYSPTTSLLMDTNKFLTKWLKDVALQQREDGCVASIVPDAGLLPIVDGAAGWADAIIIVPYVLYQAYGNQKVLTDRYDNMKRWMNYLENRAHKKTHISRRFKKNPYSNFTIDHGFLSG